MFSYMFAVYSWFTNSTGKYIYSLQFVIYAHNPKPQHLHLHTHNNKAIGLIRTYESKCTVVTVEK